LGLFKKVLFYSLLSITVVFLVVAGVLFYIITSSGGMNEMLGYVPPITSSFNSTDNTLLLILNSRLNQTTVFNEIIIENSTGHIVAIEKMNITKLPAYKSINMTINLNNYNLASGMAYTVNLYTAEGENYHSPFIIPEYVKLTKISLESTDTLLIDIESLADQPIVFDGVTIKEWIGNEFVQGRMGYIEGIVDTGILSQTELLPHEKTTLTITLKNGVSYGNYSLTLHNTSPSYVSGAGGSFRVTGLEDCFNRVAIIKKGAFDDVDNNTLLLEVKSMSNQTIFFNNAVVKESIFRAGYVYAFIASGNPVPMELLSYQNATIAVSLRARQGSYASSPVSFRSGNYTVNLNSSGSAVWTSFMVP